jgi:hypothetical protein
MGNAAISSFTESMHFLTSDNERAENLQGRNPPLQHESLNETTASDKERTHLERDDKLHTSDIPAGTANKDKDKECAQTSGVVTALSTPPICIYLAWQGITKYEHQVRATMYMMLQIPFSFNNTNDCIMLLCL